MDRSTHVVSRAVDTALLCVYLSPLVYTIPSDYSVIITATLAVISGSLRTLTSKDEVESMTHKEAMRFPIVGSVSLVGLFVAIKFLPKAWVNYVITFYFCLLGVFAVAGLLFDAIHSMIPASVSDRELVNIQNFTIPYLMPTPEELKITVTDIVCHILGAGAAAWYLTTKHFLSNNGLGLAFSVEGISMLKLGSTQVGVLLLVGLFVYDIFWVFCTPVMVTVAKGIDGPIKLLFPKVTTVGRQFGMLGLGDIVIPGIFVAMMLQFDNANKSGRTYFYCASAGYVTGLGVTIYVMNAFQAAQPALLYIVPCVLGAVFICACVRREVQNLWNFQSAENDEAAGSDSQPAPAESSGDAVSDKKEQ